MINVRDLTSWIRVGRGNLVDFNAETSELGHFLQAQLPSELAPWGLVSSTADGDARKWIYRRAPLAEFKELHLSGVTRFFIFSEQVTSSFDIDAMPFPSAFCSLNGFLILDHNAGHMTKCNSSLGIVRRVMSSDRATVIEHLDYFTVFLRLRRILKSESGKV